MISNIEGTIKKSIEEERKKFILGALNEGLDLKVVATITGLDEQQIKEIMGEN